MKKVDGLCSPGSASSSSTVSISLEQQSSQTVTFPAVPMVTGQIPITIALYELEEEEEKTKVDAIQKMLLVMVRGILKYQYSNLSHIFFFFFWNNWSSVILKSVFCLSVHVSE